LMRLRPAQIDLHAVGIFGPKPSGGPFDKGDYG
jgi:hypothetical protein